MNSPNSSLPAKPKVDELSGQQSLHDHIIDKANDARLAYGPYWDFERIQNMMKDSKFVRFPVQIVFDASPLEPGEFAFVHQKNDQSPSDGFILFIHPFFEQQDDVLPLLIAYHLVVVNYGDIADSEEAEIFGATLMNMDKEEYYQAICALADQVTQTPGQSGNTTTSQCPHGV